jgi:SAM-dependent methyltransferase
VRPLTPQPRHGKTPRGNRLGRAVPYLEGILRTHFDAWLDATVARHTAELEFKELRKGAQALSSLYVERRAGADLAARAVDGRGKRAALATYYAPLHFLATQHALATIGAARFGAVRRVFDLGCGTGAAGAAAARMLDCSDVTAIDRSGFALGEARHTYAAFGLLAKTKRALLPDATPRAADGDLWVLGWSVNELDAGSRDELGARIVGALQRGVRMLLLEPLAGGVSPWWPTWCGALAAHGVNDFESKSRVVQPEWIARLDRAAALDHRVIGARVLAGPFESGAE